MVCLTLSSEIMNKVKFIFFFFFCCFAWVWVSELNQPPQTAVTRMANSLLLPRNSLAAPKSPYVFTLEPTGSSSRPCRSPNLPQRRRRLAQGRTPHHRHRKPDHRLSSAASRRSLPQATRSPIRAQSPVPCLSATRMTSRSRGLAFGKPPYVARLQASRQPRRRYGRPLPQPKGLRRTCRGTVFADHSSITATQSITQGVAPFTGRYRPEGTLSAFAGEP